MLKVYIKNIQIGCLPQLLNKCSFITPLARSAARGFCFWRLSGKQGESSWHWEPAAPLSGGILRLAALMKLFDVLGSSSVV
jgi:hypothetical protein